MECPACYCRLTTDGQCPICEPDPNDSIEELYIDLGGEGGTA